MAGRGSVRCPAESAIVGFLEHRLPRGARAEIERHIDDCASCRRVVAAVSAPAIRASAADAHTTYPAAPRDVRDALATGTIIGRFVVIEQLGAGGMGVVYAAYDPELDRNVALKLVRAADGASDAQLREEARVMARIHHANVIAVYDVGVYREHVFVAMELVEGTTLRRWIAERPRRWRRIVDVFLRAGEGLAAAHAAGVVHGDFKPENVLVGRDGRIKVADFGLASRPSTKRTAIAGTPGYLPVEGFRSGELDERGDQFSFCVALHEAIHGSRPFSSHALDQLVAEVRRGPAYSGPRRAPRRLCSVVRRGLAFAPADRYPSMRALLAALRITARRSRRPR